MHLTINVTLLQRVTHDYEIEASILSVDKCQRMEMLSLGGCAICINKGTLTKKKAVS